ncbi:ABC-2 transporter permease [Sporolactobacillus sp. CQH2019]|uniref:ABC-2 transporter permease n=1 Tax=Sporolactobacillus sp. CQH2019 TaxID=3023512 RepID=UPI00236781BA|nr:ABC-2 transporter permease [Sporolactobacillus sp. CQH2019]MDD9149153.1 ABC-2 transporter permease [Sporolactobacillus sp. CQH2019]
MLINLVKKDFLLIKKYLLFFILFVAVAPVYMSWQSSSSSFHSLIFFLVAIVTELVLYLQIAKLEDQYKGAALLCATPYTRNTFIEAKYLFLFIVFIAMVVIQMIISLIAPTVLGRLTVQAVAITFMALSLLFAVLIPVQIKIGFDKAKLIFLVIIFFVPFTISPVIKWFQSLNLHFTVPLPLPTGIQAWLPIFIGMVFAAVSMLISLKIYAKKDL